MEKHLYMMREIGVHDNYKISSNEIQTMNICCPISLLSHILRPLQQSIP